MEHSPTEKLTKGLDGLRERCAYYQQQGARFAKWRAVITIGKGIPSANCIEANASALARYARTCQDADLVPIVEPEVLMDGDHTIETCYEVSAQTLRTVYDALSDAGVYLPGTLLKPSMIIPGKNCRQQADSHKIAQMTLQCMRANVPTDVPGLVFLSGGQSELEATRHLNAINSHGEQAWALSFSFGRALQHSALHAWNGNNANIPATQAALLHRAQMSSQASLGLYSPELEATSSAHN